MNIHEHQAKDILKSYGAPISNGVVIYSKSEIESKIKKLRGSQFVIKNPNAQTKCGCGSSFGI